LPVDRIIIQRSEYAGSMMRVAAIFRNVFFVVPDAVADSVLSVSSSRALVDPLARPRNNE
jgi:hypothetical protein